MVEEDRLENPQAETAGNSQGLPAGDSDDDKANGCNRDGKSCLQWRDPKLDPNKSRKSSGRRFITLALI